MKTNNRATLILEYDKERYNYETGRMQSAQAGEVIRPCHISDLGIERSVQLFGNYAEGRKVLRFQQPTPEEVKQVKVDGKTYKVFARRLNGTVLYVGGDNILWQKATD